MLDLGLHHGILGVVEGPFAHYHGHVWEEVLRLGVRLPCCPPPDRPHFSHCLSVTLTVSNLSVLRYRPGIRSQFTMRQPSSRSMGCSCKNECDRNTAGCIPARKGISYCVKSVDLVVSSACVQIPVAWVGRLFLVHFCKKSNNQKSYGDLILDTRPRKKNHEAAGSQHLTPVDTNALLYDPVMRRENQ